MERISKIVDEFFKKSNVAGMSVAVTDKNSVVFSGDYGLLSTDIENSNTPNGALYRIASVTKVVTGLTILKLKEKGKINLDTPIKEYVPYIKFSDKLTEDKVTMRHLLSHISGLPKEYEPDGDRNESGLKASLEKIENVSLLSSLGEKNYCYSNWGIRLAGLIAQEVSGVTFSELVKCLILEPLEMNMSFFDPMIALTYPTSLPHLFENGEYKVLHKINENAPRYATGGLFSNTDDLCRLARFIMNKGISDKGEKVLSEQALNEMFTPQVQCNGGLYNAYGLTSMFFERDGIMAVGHLGSHPPYATSLIIDTNIGYSVATLMNTYNKELRLDIPFEIFKSLKR